MGELREVLDLLKYKQWYYEAKAIRTCPIHETIDVEEVPEGTGYIHPKVFIPK